MEAQNFTGPTHYVSSVAVLNIGGEHLIYVGSNDACIYCYDVMNSVPRCILVGHSGTGKSSVRNFLNRIYFKLQLQSARSTVMMLTPFY